MWSRVVEVMLGCWLLISPFVFQHASNEPMLWSNDLTCGTTVIVLALLSYWRPARHAHVFSLTVGGWLIEFAYLRGLGSAPPASQNHLVLGLLLLIFAVIPNNASRPAAEWEELEVPGGR